MLSKRPGNIKIIFAFALILTTGSLFSQVSDSIEYDTTNYIPYFYKGSLDYNLMIAASEGYTGEVDRLILKGADVLATTDEGVTPLIFAISNDRTKAAKMLINYGSDPNQMTSHGETPLLIAVKRQNAEIAEALLRSGAEIDSTDKFKATPLHYAAVYDYLQVTDMLLYYNASMNKRAIEGSTPLLAAVWAGNADIADLLIQNGAKIEIPDNEGFTPFLIAAMNGDTLIMKLLIKKGVNIYATNKSLHNALALTIIAGHQEATKFLLKSGNRWTDKKYNAINPYAVAAKYRRKDMIQILQNNNIPGNIRYEIDEVDVSLSTRFSFHDIYEGISFSFREPYIDGGFLFGFDTKLWYTKVLLKQTENAFYQYRTKGSIVYAGVFKNFALTDHPFKANIKISTSLSAGYMFGNELKGTLLAPADKFKIIPSASLVWTKKDLTFSLGTDYMKTSYYHNGPFWFRIGASYNLYFNNIRTNGKTLKWY
jgi:ankyrin repeat protein